MKNLGRSPLSQFSLSKLYAHLVLHNNRQVTMLLEACKLTVGSK